MLFRIAVLRFELARVRRAVAQVRAFNARLAPAIEAIERHNAWEAISGEEFLK